MRPRGAGGGRDGRARRGSAGTRARHRGVPGSLKDKSKSRPASRSRVSRPLLSLAVARGRREGEAHAHKRGARRETRAGEKKRKQLYFTHASLSLRQRPSSKSAHLFSPHLQVKFTYTYYDARRTHTFSGHSVFDQLWRLELAEEV